MKTTKRWKFLREGLKSEHQNFTWEIGKWYKTEGELDICNNGFHCSKEIGQAFGYVQGELLAEVEVRGKSVEEDDKDCWEEMLVVKVWNWEKKNSVAISIFSAELCIANFEKVYPNDNRPRLAIEAAKAWLENPTEENESAAESARSAARSAAWSAAESARSAAWSAAESAAWSARSAARSAAWSAAESARSAAWSAAESAAESATLKKIYKAFDEEQTKLTKYEP